MRGRGEGVDETCRRGGKADALDLESNEETRGGSNPSGGTL